LRGDLRVKFAIGLAILFIILVALEYQFPLRKRKRARQHRWLINLMMGGALYASAALSIQPTVKTIMAFTTQSHFGLLHTINIPMWLEVALGFLLLDLTFYYWHRLNHEVPLLWRFHNVHHTDPDLDVSTALRFHFVEIIYSAGFRLMQLALLGVSPITLLLYEIIFQGNTYIHHSNIKLPIRLEYLLNKIIVTPRMHGIHHSQVREETNANYSSVFSIWDRIHNTLNVNIPQQKVTIGIAAYDEPQDNYLWSLIAMPLVKQRQYDVNQEGVEVVRSQADLVGGLTELVD